jgi:2-polyprenyl-6-methoxyphenol hydroxylase-like FAD-dependent oxidoreductase
MRVILIGAGIGGATAALALQSKGVDVAAYDGAAEESHTWVGSGMQIAPNGLSALDWVRPGIADEIVQSGVILEHMEFLNSDGDLLAEWPIGEWGRNAGGCTVTIRRGDLQQHISKGIPDGIVRYGHVFAEFEQDADEVRVRFENGHEDRGDVLIGADGLRSSVRRQLLDDGAPDSAGYTSYIGVVPSDESLVELHKMRQFIGKGRRFVMFHVDLKTVCWVGYIGADVKLESGDTAKEEVIKAYDGWPHVLGTLVYRTPEKEIRKSLSFARKPVRQWGQDRVTLLGDAAHPMVSFGQGANQAIEDAVVLSRCLTADGDSVAALRSYEEKRIDRTNRLVKIAGASVNVLQWDNPVASMVRNRIMFPVFTKTVLPKTQTELYSYRASDA